ncbi:hypothetical protein [Croceicoccus sp. BE223]|uniref:hypothetical protein n=1 Tax=Croceicoccus sp. BE223 TaxID=2817716 RepID=UPI002856E5DA|nr:hypothetical protein [Croceicoccus sp. BE223]MDR7102580.1 hypothetical protein [Croceicoccus sp. BE223]
MGKFKPLAEYCMAQSLREFELPFHRIEQIIGGKLPASALRPQYWANTSGGSGPVRAEMKATPCDTFLVSGSKRVRFARR